MTAAPAGSAGAGPPAGIPAGGAVTPRSHLAGPDNGALLAIAQSPPRSSERATAARELLVIRHRNLVRSCVARYTRSPEQDEDLMQAGYVGLMKAINTSTRPSATAWPPTRSRPSPASSGGTSATAGGPSTPSAQFRNWCWPSARNRGPDSGAGPRPAEADLAARLNVSGAELRQARLAQTAFWPSSAGRAPGRRPRCGQPRRPDGRGRPRIEHMLAMQVVAAHWDELPARERTILMLRFHGDLSQAEIGRRIGVSQMQVSRISRMPHNFYI